VVQYLNHRLIKDVSACDRSERLATFYPENFKGAGLYGELHVCGEIILKGMLRKCGNGTVSNVGFGRINHPLPYKFPQFYNGR